MNTISSITSSGYAAPPVKHTASIEKIFQGDTDTFIANSAQEEMPCVERQGRMTQEQIETLSKQYDLHNMDRNQFSRLLAELRDSGVITPQEYSAAYAGTMPQGMPQKPVFPFGKEKADFVQLMEQCAKCCADLPASPDGEALTSVYTRLNAVFNQIDQSGQADPAGEQPGDTQVVEKNSLQEQYSEKVIQLYEQLDPEEERWGLTDASSTTTRELAKDFRLLADYNHVVLAGHPTKYGIQFITWERSPDQTSLRHGHYYGPDGCVDNYTIAKQDFVTRSGLANCNAFLTPDQLTEVYRSICETLESGEPLTEKRKNRLEFAARKIEQGIPDLWARVELSIQNEQELNHMQLSRDEGIQFT